MDTFKVYKVRWRYFELKVVVEFEVVQITLLGFKLTCVVRILKSQNSSVRLIYNLNDTQLLDTRLTEKESFQK
jgi:hypothetical protein